MENANTIIFFAIIIVSSYFFTCWIRKQASKNVDGHASTWNSKTLTKEQQMIVKKQYEAYRQKIYEKYPKVANFEKEKRGWIGFLILMGLVLNVAKYYVAGGMAEASSVYWIMRGVWSFAPGMLFLLAAMGYRWRLAGGLYFLGFSYVMTTIDSLLNGGIDSWETFSRVYIEGFKQYPLEACLDVFSWIYTLLILLTAIWYTLVRHNRELAEQSEQLNVQLKNFKPTGI